MWQSSVRGLILNQIDFSGAGLPVADEDDVVAATFAMLGQLAWFHRFPVIVLAALTTLFCVARFGTTLDRVSPENRRRFIAVLGRIPPWDLLTKLVGSVALLHRFDAVSGTSESHS